MDRIALVAAEDDVCAKAGGDCVGTANRGICGERAHEHSVYERQVAVIANQHVGLHVGRRQVRIKSIDGVIALAAEDKVAALASADGVVSAHADKFSERECRWPDDAVG